MLVCPGPIGRLEVRDETAVLDGSAVSCLVLDGSAVPVWWWERAGSVECLVGLAQDEFRSAASRVAWRENQV